jgi:hypothetical protein
MDVRDGDDGQRHSERALRVALQRRKRDQEKKKRKDAMRRSVGRVREN